jgi:hypothetical protein
VASTFTISLSGLNAVNFDINNFRQSLFEEIDFELQSCAIDIVRDAKIAAARNAKNIGFLERGISQFKVAPFQYQVISSANYSAFVEFGTKKLVQIPAGFEDLAAQFRGAKLDTGTMSFQQAIYAWADQKGIAKERWHGIFMKLLFVGARPHPFLIPAYIANTNKLQTRLNALFSES